VTPLSSHPRNRQLGLGALSWFWECQLQSCFAMVALFGAMGQFGHYVHVACQAVGACPAPVRPNLQLDDFISEWKDGGTNGTAVCEPVRLAYEKSNPGYNVKMEVLSSDEGHRVVSQGLDLKHDQYKYHCKFWGEPKLE
jgi:hypothetical protein